MDLAAANSDWESSAFMASALTQIVYIFDSIGGLFNPIGHQFLESYECLDSAYRRAEARTPKDELIKYKVPPKQQQGLDNTVCIICQSPLLCVDDILEEGTGHLYKLPCSHCFHEHCAQQWLRDHSSCPVCRYDLKKDTK